MHHTVCVSMYACSLMVQNIDLHDINGADDIGEYIGAGLTTSGSPLSRHTKLLSDSSSRTFNASLMAIPRLNNSNSLVIQIK